MKRMLVSWLALALVVGVVGVALSGHSAHAQDGTSATVAALQTKVAKQGTSIAKRDAKIDQLQTRVAKAEAKSPVPAATATSEQASAGGAASVLGGNALSLLPSGEKGKVDVVAVGPYDGNELPLLVRNNSGKDVVKISVSATAHGADGSLIAAGGDQGFVPYGVKDGSYALGYIYFDGATLPADVKFEFDVQSEPDTGDRRFAPVDLDVKNASFLGDRIVGELVNASAQKVSLIGVSAICVDGGGAILGFERGFVDKEETGPGESAPFQISIYDGVDCTNFILAANGYGS